MADRRKSRRSRRGGRSPAAPQATAVMVPEPRPIVIHPPVHGAADAEPQAAAMRLPARVEPAPAADDPLRDLPVIHVREDAPEQTTGEPRRAFSLDALRGLFLVAMTVGFTVRGDLFPLWMYHRQFPPPGDLVPLAGIAWRDLTYVAFLFTMAAALPLTLSRRIARGETEIAILWAAFTRYVLLLVFALLIGHSNTYFTGYTQTARGVAVAGFVVMALLFTRPRADWSPRLWSALHKAGWGLAILFLAASPLLYGERFSPSRIDEVIAGLAFASLAGSAVWYFTRENLVARLGVLAAAVALYLGARGEGWVQEWWWSSPAPWAFAPSRLSLLTIVIPGTIAGDVILRWTRARGEDGRGERWTGGRLALLALLAAAFAPVITVGMYNRAVLLTTQVATALVIAGCFLIARPGTPLERMLRSLFLWGAAWILLGLWMEPFEGGMRKVPETLSYLVTVTGISVMLLVALTVVSEGLGRRRWLAPLMEVGHNPMLCYVLYTVLLNSVLELIPPLRGVLRQSAGEIALRMMLETLVVVLIVRAATRHRLLWRT